ncbi:SPOSA6832_03393 [Sporobolomyces salmonicolor]|uniref:SPOSA6832_03393-mRNA-1:cds n=1 Tax=Sporidiobolus salmonicolor TaxID=5005 RepID=A0A0D6ENY8_SPOSA|nr:SPOSA6832_03393 [Sporobolomyces salmonicolor]
MRTALVVTALAAVGASAAAVPFGASGERAQIAKMKRDYVSKLEQRSSLAKRQSVTTGGQSLLAPTSKDVVLELNVLFVAADDATILEFALILEHLEDAFYSQALSKFNASSFNSAGYNGLYPVLKQVAADEHQHVEFLTSALTAAGATPPQALNKPESDRNYTFPYTDVHSFLALSQVIEGVGVSAYLGAAGDISDATYLTAAGSILTVEARHNAFIRFINGYVPFASPEDTPQSASNVVTIVTPFFKSCPSGSAPTIKGHPSLNLSSTNATIGSTLKIAPSNSSVTDSQSGTVYCGFASGLAAGFSTWSKGECQVPTANVTNGQTYVVLTTGPSLSDNTTLAGPAIINLGPQNVSVVLTGSANVTSKN